MGPFLLCCLLWPAASSLSRRFAAKTGKSIFDGRARFRAPPAPRSVRWETQAPSCQLQHRQVTSAERQRRRWDTGPVPARRKASSSSRGGLSRDLRGSRGEADCAPQARSLRLQGRAWRPPPWRVFGYFLRGQKVSRRRQTSYGNAKLDFPGPCVFSLAQWEKILYNTTLSFFTVPAAPEPLRLTH